MKIKKQPETIGGITYTASAYFVPPRIHTASGASNVTKVTSIAIMNTSGVADFPIFR